MYKVAIFNWKCVETLDDTSNINVCDFFVTILDCKNSDVGISSVQTAHR